MQTRYPARENPAQSPSAEIRTKWVRARPPRASRSIRYEPTQDISARACLQPSERLICGVIKPARCVQAQGGIRAAHLHGPRPTAICRGSSCAYCYEITYNYPALRGIGVSRAHSAASGLPRVGAVRRTQEPRTSRAASLAEKLTLRFVSCEAISFLSDDISSRPASGSFSRI